MTGYPYLYDPVTPGQADPMSLFIYKATRLADGLNGSIAAAARATGAEYVDVRAAFAGHGVNSATTTRGSISTVGPNQSRQLPPERRGLRGVLRIA